MTPPASLTISSATAGGQPTAVSDQSARYSVTAATGQMKISGKLLVAPPAGVTITITLSAPTGAVSLGTVVLSNSDQPLVRYIPVGQYSNMSVTFTLSASVSAGVVPYSASDVILTLSADP